MFLPLSIENHQTRTQYDDALVLKLFGFQFVNSYASLFYIAFFREVCSFRCHFQEKNSYYVLKPHVKRRFFHCIGSFQFSKIIGISARVEGYMDSAPTVIMEQWPSG